MILKMSARKRIKKSHRHAQYEPRMEPRVVLKEQTGRGEDGKPLPARQVHVDVLRWRRPEAGPKMSLKVFARSQGVRKIGGAWVEAGK